MDDKIYQVGDGMPTGPEVLEIQKCYPDLKPGDQVPYEEIEKLIKENRGSSRFWTVTNAWRKRELDNGKGRTIQCCPGSHFYVATDEQIAGGVHKSFDHIVNTHRSSFKKVSTMQAKSEEMKIAKDHLQRLTLANLRDAKKSRMNILPPMLPARQVQIAPPDKDFQCESDAK